MFDKTMGYIHMNPVMAGFVINPEDWKYSSARDFCSSEIRLEKGLIELKFSSDYNERLFSKAYLFLKKE
jgi:hypothetical protein